MNILHLLSQNHLTGAEVYAATLTSLQIHEGHKVFQVSNGFFYPTQATTHVLEVETKSNPKFFKNALWLRKFLIDNEIHVIHTHSRAAAKLAYYARIGLKVSMVSTVHGRQHASISKKLFSKYGEFIIPVCESIQKHLITDFGYDPARIQTIRNAIDESKFAYMARPEIKNYRHVAIVGRTTGPKKTRTEIALLNLFVLQPESQVTLVGGHIADLELPNEIKSQLSEISLPSLTGFDLSKYDLIIGAGRVCMEALLCGIPTIAFGEAEYVGLVKPENFYQAMQSNFGDIHLIRSQPEIDEKQFKKDLQTFLTTENLKELANRAFQEFSRQEVWKKIRRVYESAYFLRHYKKWIPVLMYHKIPKTEILSQHRIFVTQANFEKHLKFYRMLGFQTITFSDLEMFRTGQKSFSEFPQKPLVLTFDDGYRDNLENASPLLEKYGFKAQLFLLANSDIKDNHWDIGSTEPAHEIIAGEERKRWTTSRFEVGSHGFSHRKITEMNDADALAELVESKRNLEAELGIQINSFAFTYGITSSRAAELAQQAGYSYAVNTDTGGLIMEEDPYKIFRANIFPEDGVFSLWKKTSSWYRKYYFKKRKK